MTTKKKKTVQQVRFGSKHPRAKLDEEKVYKIKRAVRDFSKIMGDQYDVSPRTITDIIEGDTWSHVKL